MLDFKIMRLDFKILRVDMKIMRLEFKIMRLDFKNMMPWVLGLAENEAVSCIRVKLFIAGYYFTDFIFFIFVSFILLFKD